MPKLSVLLTDADHARLEAYCPPRLAVERLTEIARWTKRYRQAYASRKPPWRHRRATDRS